MAVGRNSRYTPPGSMAGRSAGRQGAERNIALGLGAGNMGDSATARRAQDLAFERSKMAADFDRRRAISASRPQSMGQAGAVRSAHEAKVARNREIRGNVRRNVAESRSARSGAATERNIVAAQRAREEFGGGMGMGIPSGARTGGHVPMLERPDKIGLNVRRNVAASQNARHGAGVERAAVARAEFGGGMGMGIPSGVRTSGHVPMLERPDQIGLHVRRNVAASQNARRGAASERAALPIRRNVAASQAAREGAAYERDAVAGARSISDTLKAGAARAKALREGTQKVSIRPRTPISTAGEDIVSDALKKDKGRNFEKLGEMLKANKGLAIGAGAVIGMGLYLRGREKRGTSSGAHGAYR